MWVLVFLFLSLKMVLDVNLSEVVFGEEPIGSDLVRDYTTSLGKYKT